MIRQGASPLSIRSSQVRLRSRSQHLDSRHDEGSSRRLRDPAQVERLVAADGDQRVCGMGPALVEQVGHEALAASRRAADEDRCRAGSYGIDLCPQAACNAARADDLRQSVATAVTHAASLAYSRRLSAKKRRHDIDCATETVAKGAKVGHTSVVSPSVSSIINTAQQTVTLSPPIMGVAGAEWVARHRAAIAATGVEPHFVGSGDALAAALAADWSVAAVIVDLALVTPALARRLGPDGPRLLAFGDAAHAGVALAANLADFVPDEPSPAEWEAAVATALTAMAPVGVAELSDRSVARLGALGADATRIAAALARLTAPAGPAPALDLARVRGVIRARTARARFFPSDLFGEPAWDMLLDLALAAGEGRDVAVSSLCIAAAVPTTTALRWIRNLCDVGLFVRRDDPADARRAFVSLTDGALDAMARYLARAPD